MLEGLLLINGIVMPVVPYRIRIQAHAPSNTPLTNTMLGINDRVTARGSVSDLGVLLLEDGKVALGFPVPDAVGREEKVHLLKSALVGFRVQSPHHGDGDDVAGAEDVVGLFAERFEHNGAEETQPSVADGPADHTPGVTLGSDFQGEDLCRVQPWDGKPGGAEDESEDVDHSDRGVTVAGSFGDLSTVAGVETEAGESAGEEHGNTLANRSPVERVTTTDSIKCEDTDQGGELVES